MDQLTTVTLGLQAWSPAQLYESVVDFFANHLNVANHNEAVWTTRHLMDRDVIRKHAFGSFTDMLLASAKHPAMLQYLNLAAVHQDRGQRELRPRAAGAAHRRPRRDYTEADVKNSAKILTGRTVDADFNYLYNSTRHWVGPVTDPRLQPPNSTAAGGEAAGDAYLRYLAAPPDHRQPPGPEALRPVRLRHPDAVAGGRGGQGLPGQRHPDHPDAATPSSGRPSSGPAAAPRCAGRPRT